MLDKLFYKLHEFAPFCFISYKDSINPAYFDSESDLCLLIPRQIQHCCRATRSTILHWSCTSLPMMSTGSEASFEENLISVSRPDDMILANYVFEDWSMRERRLLNCRGAMYVNCT